MVESRNVDGFCDMWVIVNRTRMNKYIKLGEIMWVVLTKIADADM